MGGKGSGRYLRPVAPCGTTAKYQWHRRRKEDCAICKEAHRLDKAAKRKPKFRKNRIHDKVRARTHIIEAKLARKVCLDCGLEVNENNYSVFDFDHRDPTEKLFGVSTKYYDVSRAKLDAEIAKCDLVCANCHRLRTKRQFEVGILTGRKRIETKAIELEHLTLF